MQVTGLLSAYHSVLLCYSMNYSNDYSQAEREKMLKRPQIEPASSQIAGSSLDKDIGSTALGARIKTGLSQAAVAEWMTERGFAWHQTTVAKVEAGERPLRLSEAVALGTKLDVDLPTLVGDPTDARRKMAALLELEVVDAIRGRDAAQRKVVALLERLDQVKP